MGEILECALKPVGWFGEQMDRDESLKDMFAWSK